MKSNLKNKFKQNNDSLFIRTFLMLQAISFIGVSIWVININESIVWWGYTLLIIIFIFGVCLMYIALFTKVKIATKVANATGNHEVLILFVLLACLISSGIKELSNEH